MSDRIDFYEVRKGEDDDWDHVCFCKEEKQAVALADLFSREYQHPHFVEHVELVYTVDVELRDY